MPLRWTVGPPGSGKTETLIQAARAVAGAGGQLLWLGLPTQRGDVLRRLARPGPLLGVRFLSLQQLAYELLGAAGRLHPQLTGTARLALVAEALLERDGVLPSPGEARLFADAIAEAKRHGMGEGAIEALAAASQRPAGELERLGQVWAAYEVLKGDAWDYDDVRMAARELAEGPSAVDLGTLLTVGTLVIDGLRELPQQDAALVAALGRAAEVWVATSEEPPPELAQQAAELRRLEARPNRLLSWRFPNPVSEVRTVLRSLAADLAGGMDARDLAVVAPPGEARAMLALAPEFGVRLVDEGPRALVDLPYGRLLVDLLELSEHPTASRLLAVPELAPLGREALARGLGGGPAVQRLAAELGMEATWQDWSTALEPPSEVGSWSRRMVALAADLLERPSAGQEEDATVARAQEAALRRAQEATRLAGAVGGESFRAWWLALLRSSSLSERPRPGVALIAPRRVAGRRFLKAYLMGAVAGAYRAGEGEDYFVPEELRRPADQDPQPDRPNLPRRFRGQDPTWRAELRSRADVVVISHADGDRDGPQRPDTLLLGAPHGDPPPVLPTSSPLEAEEPWRFEANLGLEGGGPASVETLRRAQECAFQAWALPLADEDPRAPWTQRARRELTREPRLDAERRAQLARDFPALGPWLERHAKRLEDLHYGQRLQEVEDGPSVRLDAVERGEDGSLRLLRFTLPDEDAGSVLRLDQRWNELWAADLLRRRYPRQAARVDVYAWPLGGEPQLLSPEGVDARELSARRQRLRAQVDRAHEAWRDGPPLPNPGFRCRDCPVADLCREGLGSS